MNTITRPALGQRATVGTLYDARRDRFLPDSLLRDTGTPEAITSTAIDRRQTTSINSDSFKEKFAKLGLNNELIASFLAGMVNVQGSARYLIQKRDSLPTVHRALLYTLATRQENLNFTHPNLKDILDFSALHTGNATHVVIGITWGARTVVAATHRLTPGTDRSKYELSLHESFRTFDESDGGNVPGLRRQWQETDDDSPHVKVFSDVPDNNDDPPEDLESAFRHARSLSDRVEADKDGKSKPLTYALLPIGALVTLGAVILEDVTVGQLSSECLEKYINLVDDLSMAQQSLNAYYQSLKLNRFLVRPDHFTDVEDRLRTSKGAESDLASHYAQSLEAVRAGRSSSQKTWQILEDFLAADSAPGRLVEITNEYGEKLEFISMAVEQGAEFVGDSERSLHEALRKNARGSAKTYVFYFKNALMNKDASWEENVDLLRHLLKEGQHKSLVLLVDCDVTGQQLQQCHISVFSKETVVTKDLLKERKLLADKHLLRYDSRYLEPITNLPSQRRTVKIPCPGPDCSPHDVYAWVCSKCHMSPEYGKADRFFYCDCGRFPSDRVEFNCQRPNHGPTFARYQRPVLSKLLKSLPPPKEVNILILGETGVGKSTFVNAFINYLTFSSLDEGLSANDLNWVIPCSFTTQLIDENDRLVSKNITIGSDGDERDGSKGQSATQMATVYPLYIGDILIRLIDTPGIGDTRGLDQDAKNMTNVLSVLRNYPDLHGILILLKPNNARLGVMFRFCVKELLTHLHRSAAENMVFGFTNTRGSNYAPGDTFKPLEKLLSDYRDVIPGLFRKNVYCFDSEGFRYLAARKQNIDMGNIDDYRRSWDHSTTEAERLLAHFRTLRPHHTQRTLSLNETRHLIAQLTAPMQQISTAITDSIANSEKHAKDLSDTRLTGQALRAKLQIQKVVVNATPLSRPKTVCANSNCVETVLNENDGQQVLLRKNLCKLSAFCPEIVQDALCRP
jgi:GTPase SAR1 family protein